MESLRDRTADLPDQCIHGNEYVLYCRSRRWPAFVKLASDADSDRRIEHGRGRQLNGVRAGVEVRLDMIRRRNPADTHQFKIQRVPPEDTCEQPDLVHRRLPDGFARDAAGVPVEQQPALGIDDLGRNAVHHDQRVRVRGDGSAKGGRQRLVGDVADFDEEIGRASCRERVYSSV